MSKANEPGVRAKKPSRAASPKPLYTRGDYRLYEGRPGRNHEIRIYNLITRREDVSSAKTRDLDEAKKEVDKLYLGTATCPHCGQARVQEEGDDLLRIINDYAIAHGENQISKGSLLVRLDHVKRYIGDKLVPVAQCDETWAEEFRKWMLAEPFYVGSGANRRAKYRKRSTVEGSLLQLAAAIRFSGKKPLFKSKQPMKMSTPVDLRADVPLLAAMFRHAMVREPSLVPGEEGRHRRVNLLYYLRLAVATWGRPEAVLEADLTPESKQWVSSARAFRLNPAHRDQNQKYRAEVPIGETVAVWLDSLPKKPILPAGLSNATWSRMMKELLPNAAEGEAGMKMVRRAMAHMVKKRIGLANWVQGEFFGGWKKPDGTADIYALHDPSLMGLALDATNEIIAEIEALAPGAFIDAHRDHTAVPTNVISMAG